MPLVRKAKDIEEYELLPPGTYEVECTEVKEFFMEVDQFNNHDKIIFILEVIGEEKDDGSPFELSAMVNDYVSPLSALWGYLEAFGMNPQAGQDLDIEACTGRRAMAKVIHVEGKKKEGSAKAPVYNRVKEMLALPKKVARAPKIKADPEDAPLTPYSLISPEVERASEFLTFAANGDPVIDWTLFWTHCKNHKVERQMLWERFGTNNLSGIDPFDLAGAVEELAVPF